LVPSITFLKIVIAAAVTFAMLAIGLGFGALSAKSPARDGWRGHIVKHVAVYTSLPLFLAAVSGAMLLGPWFTVQVSIARWILVGASLYLALWALNWTVENWHTKGIAPEPVESGLFGIIFPPTMTFLVGALGAWLMGFGNCFRRV
jgi:hypothetical protein